MSKREKQGELTRLAQLVSSRVMLTDPRLADAQTAQLDASIRGGRAPGLTVGVWESGRLPSLAV